MVKVYKMSSIIAIQQVYTYEQSNLNILFIVLFKLNLLNLLSHSQSQIELIKQLTLFTHYFSLYFQIIIFILTVMYKRQQNINQQRQSLQNKYIPHQNTDQNQYSFQSKYSPYKHHTNSNRKSQPQHYTHHKTNLYQDNDSLIQHQLKRQKQKSRILEERIKNKQIFIAHMKQLQIQLTQAFDKSQQQLNYYKTKISQTIHIQTRQYIQQIAQLKHTILQLQNQNKTLKNNTKSNQYIQKTRLKTASQLHQNAINHNQFPQRQYSRQRYRKDYEHSSKKKQASFSPKDQSFHQTNNNQSIGKQISRILQYSENQINKQGKRIGKFLFSFLMLVDSCNQQNRNMNKNEAVSLKQRLKFGWKWIKTIVRESIEIKQNMRMNEKNLINERVMKLLRLKYSGEIEGQIQRLLKQNKYSMRIINLLSDHYRIGQTNLKKLEQIIRDKFRNS